MTGEAWIEAIDAGAAEDGTDNGAFRVSRPGSATNASLRVNYTVGGTASNGVDYALLGDWVEIPEGATNAQIAVSPVHDELTETDETVVLTLAAGGYKIGTPASATVTITNSPKPRAFPGAEGFGAWTVGGCGGTVYEVVNLNSSGPGSLSAAAGASGPRIVVFRVSGNINGGVSISNPYITIAGQTAPGDGICITNGYLSISANEVIVNGLIPRIEV